MVVKVVVPTSTGGALLYPMFCVTVIVSPGCVLAATVASAAALVVVASTTAVSAVVTLL